MFRRVVNRTLPTIQLHFVFSSIFLEKTLRRYVARKTGGDNHIHELYEQVAMQCNVTFVKMQNNPMGYFDSKFSPNS